MTTPIVFDVQGSGRNQFVYVIEFSSGTVKVGRTKTLDLRISQHAAAAKRHGHTIVRSWVSQPHVNYRANEKTLIEFCAARWSSPVGNEYFTGADYERVVQFANGLSFQQLTVEEEDQLAVEENERAAATVQALKAMTGALSAADIAPSSLQLRMGPNWYEKFTSGLAELREEIDGREPNFDDVALMVRSLFVRMSREEYEDAINHLVLSYWVGLIEDEQDLQMSLPFPIASIVRDELEGGAA